MSLIHNRSPLSHPLAACPSARVMMGWNQKSPPPLDPVRPHSLSIHDSVAAHSRAAGPGHSSSLSLLNAAGPQVAATVHRCCSQQIPLSPLLSLLPLALPRSPHMSPQLAALVLPPPLVAPAAPADYRQHLCSSPPRGSPRGLPPNYPPVVPDIGMY